MRFYLLLIFFAIFPLTVALASPPTGDFKALPVLHEGRVQPLDSFGRHYLKEFSGKESLNDLSASEWLAEMFFDPAIAIERPVFNFENRKISFVELSPILSETIPQLEVILKKKQDKEALTQNEEDLLLVHEKALSYSQIIRAFSFALPLSIEGLQGDLRFYELWPEIKTIEKNDKGAFAKLLSLSQAGQDNNIVKIIPEVWNGNSQDWVVPWTIFSGGSGAPQTKQLYDSWIDLIKAYESNDETSWQRALFSLQTEYHKLRPQQVRTNALKMEVIYNAIHPVLLIALLYAAAALLFLLYYISSKSQFFKIGFFTFLFSVVCHLGLLMVRVNILQRAPVGTLYESVLFVPLILSLAGLVIYKVRTSQIALFLSALLSTFLMGMSVPYSLKESTFTPLDAVLNTDFWLGTHVLCITAGYAWCLLASAMAQYEIAMGNIKVFSKTLKITLLAALFFTTVGTVLGGVWADQSWGRFWGWDPKENGALLIVLWLVWILHALVSGHLKTLPALVLTATMSIVVSLAWFGVNLLNIGLHAYGFVSGIAWALVLFISIQTIIIGILTFRAKQKCQQT